MVNAHLRLDMRGRGGKSSLVKPATSESNTSSSGYHSTQSVRTMAGHYDSSWHGLHNTVINVKQDHIPLKKLTKES